MSTNKYLELINLNNSWVITKRHNGNLFFKRKNKITCLKNFPNKDCLYFSEDEVKTEVQKLNSQRKKCLYGYENASKYFVNGWSWSRWDGHKIKNKPIPIKEVNQNTNIIVPESLKKTMLEDIKESIQNNILKIKKYRNELPLELEKLAKNYNDRIEQYSSENINLEYKLKDIEQLNLDTELASFETQGDKMVKVLYGSNK